jgi:putative transposase
MIESGAKVGAAKGAHSRERSTYFSGSRVRRMNTRLGTIFLLVPKPRKSGYIPFFVSERKRSEQALIAVVQEAFINGVSTRKIERLAQGMGIENISASPVSNIKKGSPCKLPPSAKEFWKPNIPSSGSMLSLTRSELDGKVVTMALMIAYGLNNAGRS